MRALLPQLQNDLVPTQVAHAQVRMLPEGNSSAAELGTDARPISRFKLVDASFDGASRTTLRFDQMLDAQFWRIGFTFETLDLCDAFARRSFECDHAHFRERHFFGLQPNSSRSARRHLTPN